MPDGVVMLLTKKYRVCVRHRLYDGIERRAISVTVVNAIHLIGKCDLAIRNNRRD
jgi:hypothetical protein